MVRGIRWSLHFLPFVLTLLSCVNSNGVSESSDSSDDQSPPSKKLALLIGIDEYKRVSDLRGCVNDIRDMKKLLQENYRFKEADIDVITNETATHKGIIDAFQRLIRRAEKAKQAGLEPIVVVHYSGHGSQMRDASGGDETADRWDETIVPHDSRTAGVYDVRDDALNGLFKKLAEFTPHVTFVLDSCHSGSGIRGTGVPRVVPRDDRQPPPAEEWEVSTRGTASRDTRFEDLNYVLIAGCRAEELSFELNIDGIRRGALTYYLIREIRKAQHEGVTYRDVMDQVKAHVTRRNSTQHPQVEGRLINNFVFSDRASVPHPYVLVSRQGDKLTLATGKIQRATQGSRYDVYKPGTKQFDDPNQALARLELTKVEIGTSEAKVLEFVRAGSVDDIPQQSRAIERRHVYEVASFPVYFLKPEDATTYFADKPDFVPSAPDSVGVKKVMKSVSDNPHYRIVSTASEATILLGEIQGKFWIFKTSGEPAGNRPVAATEARLGEKVLLGLEHWAKWHGVLDIENAQPGRIKVSFAIKSVSREGSRAETETRRVPRTVFEVGDKVEFVVKNTGTKKLFFVILDLPSDGSVAVLYPKNGDAEALHPGKTSKPTIELWLPEELQTVTDHFKVIATENQHKFSFLAMESAKARTLPGSSDPLITLFQDAARQSTARHARAVSGEEWATVMRVFDVVRKDEQ